MGATRWLGFRFTRATMDLPEHGRPAPRRACVFTVIPAFWAAADTSCITGRCCGSLAPAAKKSQVSG
jgi:hypothetical protein